MIISEHARKRCYQRGIPETSLDLIHQFGIPKNKPGGAIEYCINKKVINQVQTHLKNLSRQFDKMENKAVLVIGNQMITAYNKK